MQPAIYIYIYIFVNIYTDLLNLSLSIYIDMYIYVGESMTAQTDDTAHLIMGSPSSENYNTGVCRSGTYLTNRYQLPANLCFALSEALYEIVGYDMGFWSVLSSPPDAEHQHMYIYTCI
jgi:hypothetical protein